MGSPPWRVRWRPGWRNSVLFAIIPAWRTTRAGRREQAVETSCERWLAVAIGEATAYSEPPLSVTSPSPISDDL